MNKKMLLLALVMWMAGRLFAEPESQMITVKADGTETVYVLADVQKIVFENQAMTVNMKSGADSTGITCVRFLVTDNSGLENLKLASPVFVFPVPVKTNLTVAGVDKNMKINLFDLKGTLLKSVFSKDNSTDIDVSSLSPGVYLIQAGGKTVKFIKQ